MGIFSNKWIKGRQNDCEYFKIKLFYFKIFKFGFDGYILKYNKNQILPKHKDIVDNGNHYRVNIGYGDSIFNCNNIIFKYKLGLLSINFFRPDLYEHSLIIINKTYKISLGYVKFR